jgi:hypothetical protein
MGNRNSFRDDEIMVDDTTVYIVDTEGDSKDIYTASASDYAESLKGNKKNG